MLFEIRQYIEVLFKQITEHFVRLGSHEGLEDPHEIAGQALVQLFLSWVLIQEVEEEFEEFGGLALLIDELFLSLRQLGTVIQ